MLEAFAPAWSARGAPVQWTILLGPTTRSIGSTTFCPGVMLSRAEPTRLADPYKSGTIMGFEYGLAEQVDTVFSNNPEIRDHRKKHSWLTGSLGDPYSGIWFLAENPSLSMVERATNPEGGALTPEAQWGSLGTRSTVAVGAFSPKTYCANGWKSRKTGASPGTARLDCFPRNQEDQSLLIRGVQTARQTRPDAP